jgi:phosphate-selective porin OprO/OprP
MDERPRCRSRKCDAVVAFCLLCAALLPAAAEAQDSTIKRIEALERQIGGLHSEFERQIGGLQSELRRLKGELGEAKQQVRQSRSEAQRAQDELRETREVVARMHQGAPSPAATPSQAATPQASTQAASTQTAVAVPAESAGVKLSMPEGRPTIATADGRASLAIGGLTQFDMGGYFQHPNQNTQFPNLNNGVNLRRGRLYFIGTFDDFRFQITPEFGDRPDGAPTIFEANFNYTGIKPLTFTVGYFHPFVSLDDATFPGNTLFLERPSIVNIERSVAAGITRASLGANAITEDYFASAYLTGPLYGSQRPTLLNGEQVGAAGRFAARPYYDKDWNLHAEFSGQMAFHPNVIASGTPGVSRTTLTLADQPELEIDFNPLVSTGPLSARSANAYGGGLAASWRNFLLAGEFYQIGVNQAKLPGMPAPRLGFNGGYIDAAWVITGEPIPYDITRAAWAKPKVDDPFSLGEGGIGAWEIAARYSSVDLNSNVVPGVPQTTTGGIFGGRQQIASLALSWYPNDWLRFILQLQHADVNKLNPSGKIQIGQSFETLAARAQATW